MAINLRWAGSLANMWGRLNVHFNINTMKGTILENKK
jgi:hypothetical protein